MRCMVRTLAEIWGKPAIMVFLVQKDLNQNYRNRSLGFLWALIDPLMFMAVYYLVFGRILANRPPSFMIHLFIGVSAFNLLSRTAVQAAFLMRAQGSLVREIRFPLGSLPSSIVIARLLDFAATWVVAIPLSLIFGNPITSYWLLIPVIVVAQTLFVSGFCFLIAYVGVFFADIQNILNVVMRLWFYMSPILYPLSLVEKKAEAHPVLLTLYKANPMAALIECYGNLAQFATVPSWRLFGYATAASVVMFVVGLWAFSRAQGQLAKYV